MTSPGYRRDRGDEGEDGNIQCHFCGRIIIIDHVYNDEAAGPARLSIFASGPFFKFFVNSPTAKGTKRNPYRPPRLWEAIIILIITITILIITLMIKTITTILIVLTSAQRHH